MTPVPTEWWLRPARSAARVGEQSAVVWNWLYRSPFFASRSRVGVGTGPPKVDAIPNPVSSVRIMSTLGEPFGAFTGWGKLGVESLKVSAILPLNSGSGLGSWLPLVGGSDLFWARAMVSRPDAVSQPSRALAANSVAAARIVRVRMGSSLRWSGRRPGRRQLPARERGSRDHFISNVTFSILPVNANGNL